MTWYVMRHPETGGVGVVAESALPIHKEQGWLRVSDAMSIDDKDQVRPGDYADAADLDAPKTKPTGRPSAETRTEN